MIETLPHNAQKMLYTRLIEKVGMFEFSVAELKTKFSEYCKKAGFPETREVLYYLVYNKNIIAKEETFIPIAEIVQGIYLPEFQGKSSEVFGLAALEITLKQFVGKDIKIIIASE